MDINPVEFGQLVAHVENLRERSTKQEGMLESLNQKMDLLVSNEAMRKGELVQVRRQQSGYITIVAALVSGAVAGAIDYFRH